MAARKVVDENRQLRELLHKHGATDDYIAQYLQASVANNTVCSRGQGRNAQTTDPGMTPQSLEQILLHRRATHLEPSVQGTLPSQSTREASIASGSVIDPCGWKCSQSTMTGYSHYSHHPRQLGLSPSSIGSSDHKQCSPSVFHARAATAQAHLSQSPRSEYLMNDARQSLATPQHIALDDRTMMSSRFQMDPFHDAAHSYHLYGAI